MTSRGERFFCNNLTAFHKSFPHNTQGPGQHFLFFMFGKSVLSNPSNALLIRNSIRKLVIFLNLKVLEIINILMASWTSKIICEDTFRHWRLKDDHLTIMFFLTNNRWPLLISSCVTVSSSQVLLQKRTPRYSWRITLFLWSGDQLLWMQTQRLQHGSTDYGPFLWNKMTPMLTNLWHRQTNVPFCNSESQGVLRWKEVLGPDVPRKRVPLSPLW